MTAYEIIRSVAIAHGLATHDIIGFSRERSIVVARHEAMAKVRADRQLSYPAIGRIFHRTHDTVLRGIRQHYRRAAMAECVQIQASQAVEESNGGVHDQSN